MISQCGYDVTFCYLKQLEVNTIVCLMMFTNWWILTYQLPIGKPAVDLHLTLLELINEMGVTQVIDHPIHKRNKILDLTFTSANEVRFKIADKFFSNQNPIILSCSVYELSAPDCSRYSRFSFDTLSFNSCLHDFFSYISRDNLTDPSFLDWWL